MNHKTNSKMLHHEIRFRAAVSIPGNRPGEIERVGLATVGPSFCPSPTQSIDRAFDVRWLVVSSLALLWSCNLLAQDWTQYNRSLALNTNATAQRYRELDTQGLTRDGTLNTERGWLTGGGAQWRWQASKDSHVPLWMQANADWLWGRTFYDGYLQSGSELTPYRARSGNFLRSSSISVGWAIPLIGGDAQLVPYLNVAQRHWQRNLTQYSESYAYRSTGIGILVQWRPSPRWVLEVGHQMERHNQATLVVSDFGYSSNIGRGRPQYTLVAMNYLWDTDIGIRMQVISGHWGNGASDIVNNLQAPASLTRQTALFAGINFGY